MKQIIIFAGTCGTGKTTVIDKILQGELSFGDRFDINQSQDWDYYPQYKSYQEKIDSNQPRSDYAILHYDIYGRRIIRQKDFQQLSRLVNEFDRVSIVTLTTSTYELKKRVRLRLFKTIIRFLSNLKNYKLEAYRLKRHYTTYKNYQKPLFLENLHNDWFEYLETLKIEDHWLLNTDRQNRYDLQPYQVNNNVSAINKH